MHDFEKHRVPGSQLRQPNPKDREIGACIRRLRVRQRITQKQLGAALGLSFTQIQKYESGANRISLRTFLDMAGPLEVSVHELLDHILVVWGLTEPSQFNGEKIDK